MKDKLLRYMEEAGAKSKTGSPSRTGNIFASFGLPPPVEVI